MKGFDAIIVGAGPAGTTAAIKMAQKGLNVLIVERSSFPGEKNMFGGMLPYCPILELLIPDFINLAPLERFVTKRTLNIMDGNNIFTFTFESENFNLPPYNGYTLFRPNFDRWYADIAFKSGAKLITSCLVDELIVHDNKVVGIKAEQDEVRAPLILLCDGVLSPLSKKIGISKLPKPSEMGLGLKVLFKLDESILNERFNIVNKQGATQEFLGCTEGVRGGAFLYTQLETISVGLVFHLDSLKKSCLPPYEILQKFLSNPYMRKLLKGAKLIEYSAHLLPENGYKGIQKLYTNGLLIAGDAAGFCYTNGLNQEGMNLAITSGFLAAETAIEALNKGDFSIKTLKAYEERLKESFILKDMKTFNKMVEIMHNDRLYSVYPKIIGKIFEQIYKSDGKPKKSLGKTAWDVIKESISMKNFFYDILKGGKSVI
ncbi:MAG: FAD-binding protein [Candidatus Goldbacteria bacterium]|nr:FAD-binding protein [Candidatus Goldiibacteriota bacterium]